VWSRREAIASLLMAPLLPSIDRLASPRADTPALHWLDAVGITRRLAARELSAVALATAHLERIERLNPVLRAFVTVTADRALADARRVDAALARRERIARLAGVPIAHKDLFETAGIRTTAGSRLYDTHVPAIDATVASRLAAAGAVLVGKTNTHELGGGVTTINPFFGTTLNPWDRTRIAGGSSGGSAAAVAAGLVVAATGSDTGGSVRIPAAFCGCVGFKPSFGRVSTAGLLGASPSFDHSGFIARSVDDVVRLYYACAGYDARDPSTVDAGGTSAAAEQPRTKTRNAPLRGLRVGVPRTFFFDSMDSGVARAMDEALASLRALGAEIGDIAFPVDRDTMARVFDPIIVVEIHAHFAKDWKARPEAFSRSFASFFQAPLPTALELAAAHRELRDYQAAVRRVFDSVNIVLTPTVPIQAPPVQGPIDGALILRNTWPFNAARTPAITIPCDSVQTLPVGVQLVAAPYREAELFRVAGALHAMLQPKPQRPPA
jgi:aspartyl-tRNA(Asn)/glutamyl-tRNA(Gln) amidotransferase subunit A